MYFERFFYLKKPLPTYLPTYLQQIQKTNKTYNNITTKALLNLGLQFCAGYNPENTL